MKPNQSAMFDEWKDKEESSYEYEELYRYEPEEDDDQQEWEDDESDYEDKYGDDWDMDEDEYPYEDDAD